MRPYFAAALLLTFATPVGAQYDSVRVVTSTRIISKADLPATAAVYDNSILMQKAAFPGGVEALGGYFRNAVPNSSGAPVRIHIGFIVESDGVVNEVQVNEGSGGELDKAVLRAAIAMPDWSPAMVKEKPVRARVAYTVELP
jgi:hypothetical protein